MPNWSGSMTQTFEYYEVDPGTWKDTKLITTVKACSINRDKTVDTLGSATIDITDLVGECYVRVYLITLQNGVKEKHPLGTFLVQTPSSSADGKTRDVSLDAYTPLLELKENQPPIGYYIPKSSGYHKVEIQRTYITGGKVNATLENVTPLEKTKTTTDEQVYQCTVNGETKYCCLILSEYYWVTCRESYITTSETFVIVSGKALQNVLTDTGEQVYEGVTTDGKSVYYCVVENFMDLAYRLARENMRAPVVKAKYDSPLTFDFVADTSDTWFTFLSDLIANAGYEFDLDEMGRVLFTPKQDFASLQPVWTYHDDNSSILYPELDMEHDLYGIPNVVEVVYTNGNKHYYSKVVNDDENSPTSTVTRGREIVYRETDPDIAGAPTNTIDIQRRVDEYAEQLLRNLSSVEYSITYSHGYCPVRPGDCVRLNYARAGLKNIKAQVVSQTINCESGCKVTEKAIFTNKLWR